MESIFVSAVTFMQAKIDSIIEVFNIVAMENIIQILCRPLVHDYV